jgi:hypothetical protein
VASQCPQCFYHSDHIFTIEISPKTHQQWRIERCPNCSHAFDLELNREYMSRRNKMDKEDKRRPDGNDSRGWMFGI